MRPKQVIYWANFVTWRRKRWGTLGTLDYRPIGGRRPGLALKRLLDGYNRKAETGRVWA